MEYLPGLTLQELVERGGPLPASRAVHFLRQVCGALQEAHAAGLIHRDLKPGNIMVCQRGGVHDVAKLLDFGLVRPLESAGDSKLTQDGTITGTPAYMSPEQAAGKSDLDGRGDIYSLGCVAYFLLTGRPPFGDGSPVQILAAHLYESPAAPAGPFPAPAGLQEIVLRCLSKPPAERFPDVKALEQALLSCGIDGEWTADTAARWWEQHQPQRADGGPLGATATTIV
jgi:serine/threonine-protein kinase